MIKGKRKFKQKISRAISSFTWATEETSKLLSPLVYLYSNRKCSWFVSHAFQQIVVSLQKLVNNKLIAIKLVAKRENLMWGKIAEKYFTGHMFENL